MARVILCLERLLQLLEGTGVRELFIALKVSGAMH